MKKSIGFSLLVLMIMALLSGCGESAPDAPLSEIAAEMKQAFSIQDTIDLDSSDLLAMYGIQAADIEEQASFTAMNGIFPDEVLLIKAIDADALARIDAKLNVRLSEVMNQSKSYDPESYAIAQKCNIDTRGLYITLFISRHHEEMAKIYAAHF